MLFRHIKNGIASALNRGTYQARDNRQLETADTIHKAWLAKRAFKQRAPVGKHSAIEYQQAASAGAPPGKTNQKNRKRCCLHLNQVNHTWFTVRKGIRKYCVAIAMWQCY